MSEYFHTVDWSDFKQMLKRAIFNNLPPEHMRKNGRSFVEHANRADSFSGITRGQLERWLSEGYKTDSIHGLADFIPPIRDKRKLIFGEEGDEFHYDIAASGDENYMSYFTKRENIPGVAIEAGIMFAAFVEASVVGAYSAWICKLAYSLESSGVDCQITLDFPSHELAARGRGNRSLYHNIVRVKKENEASDFLSWSPMLSPAALRNFGFALGDLHCDARGEEISGSFGRGVPERTAWKCFYDADRRTVVIENSYRGGNSFPEENMTRQFREALRTMQGKLTN